MHAARALLFTLSGAFAGTVRSRHPARFAFSMLLVACVRRPIVNTDSTAS
jgi:hypothetical protein